MNPRISLAIEKGIWAPPGDGRIAVFNPDPVTDLSALPAARLHLIQPFQPYCAQWVATGLDTSPVAVPPYSAAIVSLPRSKPEARALIDQAQQLSSGPVLIEGEKTNGIDGVLKELRRRGQVGEVLSKAHGKVFAMTDADIADWRDPGAQEVAGFVTRLGVFSADGPDPGSQLLADVLPSRLGARVADLGAGWGYLSRAILERSHVTSLDLVEAGHVALECARENISDDRAAFHWDDARNWAPKERLDTVVMNPPFHSGRSAEPQLGKAFIENAARILRPAGSLWLVANRHLPYEAVLHAAFGEVREVRLEPGYKVFHAKRPRVAKSEPR